MTFAPTCFIRHPQGAVQYLAKNYKYGFAVLIGIDYVHADEHSRTIFVFFSQVQLPEDGSCVNRNMSERMS
jgi:hypothetical protein